MVMEIEKVKEIKKALEDHSIEKLKYQDGIKIKEIDFISILTLINELESENNELKNIIAEEQETCVECESKQSWELFVRDKEIDRLRAENERLENNMKSVLEIEKKAVAKEILQCLYDKCYEIQNLRECVAHITPLDILILAKEYGVEVEE